MAPAPPSSRQRLLQAIERLSPRVAVLGGAALLITLIFALLAGCTPLAGRAAVPLRIQRAREAPPDASVMIDEEYIGPLSYVAARGVRLPVGEHRVSVEKPGYFPWDALVEADRDPVELKVEMAPIPD